MIQMSCRMSAVTIEEKIKSNVGTYYKKSNDYNDLCKSERKYEKI